MRDCICLDHRILQAPTRASNDCSKTLPPETRSKDIEMTGQTDFIETLPSSANNVDLRKQVPNFCESTSVERTGSPASSVLESEELRSSQLHPIETKRRSDDRSPSSQHEEVADLPPSKKPRLTTAQRESRIADAVSTILECLDDDPLRQGLQKTPTRYAKVRKMRSAPSTFEFW